MVQRSELDDSSPLLEKALEILRTEKCPTIRELTRALEREDKSISTEQIQEIVDSLERNNKIAIAEPMRKESFLSDIRKNYFDYFPLWLGIIIIAMAVGATYWTFPNDNLLETTIRIGSGGMALFFLPGFGVLTLLFSGYRMTTIERFGISFVLSLIMILVLFLLIENLPITAGRDSITVGMSVLSLFLILVGSIRQYVGNQKRTSEYSNIVKSVKKISSKVAESTPDRSDHSANDSRSTGGDSDSPPISPNDNEPRANISDIKTENTDNLGTNSSMTSFDSLHSQDGKQT